MAAWGIISLCQSAATSEIVKCFWSDSCKKRYSKYLTFTFTFTCDSLLADFAGGGMSASCKRSRNVCVFITVRAVATDCIVFV